ncbi:hypothetical protein [Trichlorobacter ammonificans]|uniref:Uncharacterized protein n=1 Tax=Trichlorobacter ammonificans TaxID=2916410 RepID=A0ABM9D9N2_9BACT|nr:hypothetical protein [Trichlorobacter ammonificans]CAH2031089.1 conserved exported protein of unknown function [Trichlorobacter ammonificans]
MKKVFALACAATVLAATVAFAVKEPTSTKGVGTFGTGYMRPDDSGQVTFNATGVGADVKFNAKLSANVFISLQSDAAGASYLVATVHGSGNKYYATSSGDSRIFMKEVADLAADPAAPPTIGATIDWSGWTAVK